ncbi:MAG: biopolymer transporter ExbD [Pseudomonadota bacterium]
MRRIFGRGREEEADEQINLTPMLDVVFIMLIFFIVTATFVKEVGLDVNQPEDDKPKTVDPDKKSIVVRITSRDRIMIAQRDVDWRNVRANIERLHAEAPEAPVIIQPHEDSKTETMIHVMDSARQAGVFAVSLATAN